MSKKQIAITIFILALTMRILYAIIITHDPLVTDAKEYDTIGLDNTKSAEKILLDRQIPIVAKSTGDILRYGVHFNIGIRTVYVSKGDNPVEILCKLY